MVGQVTVKWRGIIINRRLLHHFQKLVVDGMQMVELMEGKNVIDLLHCNLMGMVTRAFENSNGR